MAKTLGPYTGTDFYGTVGGEVPGLTNSLQHGIQCGMRCTIMQFHDDLGVKWRGSMRLNTKGRVGSLSLKHRNSHGKPGFHGQREWVWGTRGGLADLISYIAKPEAYETSRTTDASWEDCFAAAIAGEN